MDNVIRNIITIDNIANLILRRYVVDNKNDYIQNIEVLHEYYIGLVIFTLFEKNILEYQSNPTISFLFFDKIILNYFKNKNDFDIKNINKIIHKTIAKNYENYKDDLDFHSKFLQGKIDKKENNSYLLEVSLIFGFIYDDFDTLIINMVKYLKTITHNTIKTLSFISLGIFSSYAKKFYKNNDSLYNPTIWMDKLIDIFMDKIIDDKLHNIDNIDKKKFIFMLIRYNSDFKNIYNRLPHERAEDLNNCFIVKHNEINMLPGFTADQCFLYIYDSCIKPNNWFQFMLYTAFSFTEIKRITLISSWFYFLANSNIKLYDKFDVIKSFYEVDEFVKYFNNLF